MIVVFLFKDEKAESPYQTFSVSHFNIRYDMKRVDFLVDTEKGWEEYKYETIDEVVKNGLIYISVTGLKLK